jgi:hypothetical protein
VDCRNFISSALVMLTAMIGLCPVVASSAPLAMVDPYRPMTTIFDQYLPRWVAGGPGNPLGARAMYLGGTQYRIHGTNDPTTIGKKVSSGCVRLTNEDVIDLYGRTNMGAKVVVLPDASRRLGAEETARPDARRTVSQQTLPLPRASDRRPHDSLVSAFSLY